MALHYTTLGWKIKGRFLPEGFFGHHVRHVGRVAAVVAF
jgi:hypothetical protein